MLERLISLPCLLLLIMWQSTMAGPEEISVNVSPTDPTYFVFPEDTVKTLLPTFKIDVPDKIDGPGRQSIVSPLVEIVWESPRAAYLRSILPQSKGIRSFVWVVRTQNYLFKIKIVLNQPTTNGQYLSDGTVNLAKYAADMERMPYTGGQVEAVKNESSANGAESADYYDRLLKSVQVKYAWTLQKTNVRANSTKKYGQVLRYDIVGQPIVFEGERYSFFKSTLETNREYTPQELNFYTKEEQAVAEQRRIVGWRGFSVDLGQSTVSHNFAQEAVVWDWKKNGGKIHFFYVAPYRTSQQGLYYVDLYEYFGASNIINDDLRRKKPKWVSDGSSQQGQGRMNLLASGLPRSVGVDINHAVASIQWQVADLRSVGVEIMFFDGHHDVYDDYNFIFGPVIGQQFAEYQDVRWYLDMKPFVALSYIQDDAKNENVFASSGLGLGLRQRWYLRWNFGLDLEVSANWFALRSSSVDYSFVITGGMGIFFTIK